MSTTDEQQEQAGTIPDPTSVQDGTRTQRLPPGRRLDLRRRRPRALQFFTIGLTLLLIGAVIVIRSNRPDQGSNLEEQPVDQSPQVTSADTTVTVLERRVDELAAQLASQAEQTTTQIDGNTAAMHALEARISSLPTRDRVSALEQSRDELVTHVARLERSLARLRRPRVQKTAKPSEPTLPFQAVSFDLWDGVPYVGVSHDGRIELLRVGQKRGGWTVERIDYGSAKVRFRNETGHRIERALAR